MIRIGRIQWLNKREIVKISDFSSPEIEVAIRNAAIPYIVYRKNKFFRAVEVCEVFNIANRCHACLKEVGEGRTFCSEGCWTAAMGDDAHEKDELLIGVPTISVHVSAHLMRKVREEANRMEMDIPTAVRFLLDEGIEKQRRLPAL